MSYWNDRKTKEIATFTARGMNLADAKRAQRAQYVKKPAAPWRCGGAAICKICCVCGDH